MKASKAIKSIANQKNISYDQIANKFGVNKQALYNRQHRNAYSVNDLIKICEILDAELCIRDGDNVYSLMETQKDD